jgi:hypothetical protein
MISNMVSWIFLINRITILSFNREYLLAFRVAMNGPRSFCSLNLPGLGSISTADLNDLYSFRFKSKLAIL